jgi:tRNA A37 threonylcarbamoyladenosine biosynthesis protein TsaE
MSLAQIQEAPDRSVILLAEPPGAGKSAFCRQMVLNGLFSAIKNQHVREIKCIAMGDPYCEWEIL